VSPRWERQGLVFAPPKDRAWMTSHAALPIAHRVGDRHRIYFSARDERNRAQIGFFELDMTDPGRILAVSDAPVLGLGELGTFDDSGVTGSCLVEHEGRLYLYYSGWSLGVTVPFYFYVGLAVSDDGGLTFERVSKAPVLERDAVDPYLTASPSVLIENGVWRMWYVSCARWELVNGKPRHYYHIRYAESPDGVRWKRCGHVAVDFKNDSEYAMARPCVIHEHGRYKMWFCARGESYRLAYAESDDGLVWRRMDEAIDLQSAPAAWESEMQAYPAIFDAAGDRWMLYNGNGYGASGIGLARAYSGDASA
jgi:hypothetical protein